MSQNNRPDIRNPFFDVFNPGECQSGFEKERSAELRDETVFSRKQFRSGFLELVSVERVRTLFRFDRSGVRGREASTDVDRLEVAPGNGFNFLNEVNAKSGRGHEEGKGHTLAADVEVNAVEPVVFLVEIDDLITSVFGDRKSKFRSF